ncbi:class E sortase [Cellulomonas sp. URHD0024]|uniref:class E sortase n=1 Tax=Cellulomonas sp. URHD0024 TaxID=1302620 RepID=UPI000481A6D3|nr:class E sortase [Cellulomonas sp. URHD0024]
MSRTRNAVFGTIGVIGEVLITIGVLLFAFLVWQLWWTDVVGNRAQAQIVAELPFEPVPSPTPSGTLAAVPVIAPPRHDDPPVMDEPPHATTFATMQVPRWDGEPARPVSEGTDRAGVLDVLGIGHYKGTAMPGGVGNFAVAGHRTTYAKPFNRIAELKAGDPIVVRTTDNIWYVYRVTSTQIVEPSDIGVIAPVPGKPGETPTERMITLTTCHPMFSARQRYIVHGVLDYWAPTADGIPAELAGGAS